MRIVEIRERTVTLDAPIANSVVDFSGHTVSLVAVVTDVIRSGRPVVGVAFNSIGRYAQRGLIMERLAPRVESADPDSLIDQETGLVSPALVLRRMLRDEKQGGHGDRAHAAAAVELACWDALAKIRGEPAWRTIGGAAGIEGTGVVSAYAAGGYYRDSDAPGDLAEEIRGYVDSGYQAVKIKLRGADLGKDMARVEVALSVLSRPDQLAVDLNAVLEPRLAARYAQELALAGLRWLEEPVAPLDFDAYAHVASASDLPIATGENLFSADDVKNLLRFGGLRSDADLLQMDAGLSYGLTEYVRMLDLAMDAGFPRSAFVPHGGHLINLHVVAGLGLGACEAYPGVFQPVGGFSPTCELGEGEIRVGDEPGFGLEAKPELQPHLKELVA